MKITLQQIADEKEEIIIKYKQMTPQIEGIVKYLEGQTKKLFVLKDGQQIKIGIPDVIYLESVDGTTFLYTHDEVYRIPLTLALFEIVYADSGFLRCSKSMILNICRIDRLKSMPGNRIDATMDNGEHIVISRRYAKALRIILKEEA